MRLLIAFIVLFSYTGSHAQLPDSCNTVLWAVINAKGDTSYLFGTFHEFGNTYFDQYSLGITTRKVNCIVAERPPTIITELVLTTDWVKNLSKSDYRLINSYMKKMDLGYTLVQAKRIPPSFVMYAILSKMLRNECNTWNDQDVVGIDEYIMNGATTNKKQVIGLESPEDTFNVVNLMMSIKNNEDPSGISALKNLVLNEKSYRDTMRSECWEAEGYRNLKINYKFSKASASDNPIYPQIIDKRNDAWLPQIKRIIDTSTAFIAVGIKHMFYRGGLIIQLQNAGYKVVPMELQKREVHYRRR